MNYGKIDKKKFMTLENTVDTLIDAVNLHYDVDRVLADFGIRVLGRVNYKDPEYIPGYPNGPYDGHFGDAYLVSQGSDSTAPYDIVIWTRNTPDSVEPDGYWLDIGVLAIAGPPGPDGEQGIQGPPGENTRWYIYTTLPQSGDFKPGDVCLLPNGDVYMYVSSEYGWSNASQVNIKGQPGSPGQNGVTPQIGPDGMWWINNQPTGVRAEGRDGANGAPGTAILIRGKTTIDTIDLLDPKTEPRNYGYLVTIDNVVYLYYIAGIEGEETWERIEYSGNGTIVTTDGTALDTWDTNTKLDRRTYNNIVYTNDSNGAPASKSFSTRATGGSIVMRKDSGTVEVGTPTIDDDATTKKYVDDGLASKVSTTSEGQKVYGTDPNGNQKTYTAHVQEGYGNDAIPLRAAYGNILVPEDTAFGVPQQYENKCATSKKYVDDLFASVASPDYQTAIITKVGDVGQNTRLEMSDLPDIVPGTQMTIYASINREGTVAAPPPATLSIGNNNLAYTESKYLGIPYFHPDLNQTVITVFNDGTNFLTQSITSSSPYIVTGTFMDIGIADGTGGQTTLTITYTKHS